MVRINLFFDQFEDQSSPNHNIIRLKCGVQFRTPEGWGLPYSGVVDTGAHTSVLPFSVWKEVVVKHQQDYTVFGLSKKEECALSGTLAKVNLLLIDEKGNQSKEMEATFFLAETDQVPIILGFNGLLDKFKVTFNLIENSGYIEGQS